MMTSIPPVRPWAWQHDVPRLLFSLRLARNSVGGTLSSSPLGAALPGCYDLQLWFLIGVTVLAQVPGAPWASPIGHSRCGKASGLRLSTVFPPSGRNSRLCTSPCYTFAIQTLPLFAPIRSFILRTILQPTGLVSRALLPFLLFTPSSRPSNYSNLS